MNETEIKMSPSKLLNNKTVHLMCKYDDYILNNNIRWYFNKNQIISHDDNEHDNSLFDTNPKIKMFDSHTRDVENNQTFYYHIMQTSYQNHRQNYTTSSLYIHNFDSNSNLGRYTCQWKGLHGSVVLYSTGNFILFNFEFLLSIY
jgi:hypothetical protein